MSETDRKTRPPPDFDAETVRAVSVEVYRQRMGLDEAAALELKIGTEKFIKWAGAYDTLTRVYLQVLKDKPVG